MGSKLMMLGFVMMFLLNLSVYANDYEWVSIYDYGTGEDDISISFDATQAIGDIEKRSDHLYIYHKQGDDPRPGGLFVHDNKLDFSKINTIRIYYHAESPESPAIRTRFFLSEQNTMNYEDDSTYDEAWTFTEEEEDFGYFTKEIDVSDVNEDYYFHLGASAAYTGSDRNFHHKFYTIEIEQESDPGITAKDIFGDSLTNFTVEITNSTGTKTITTTNGTVPFEHDNELLDLSFYNISNQGWDYQNKTYTDVNISENFAASVDIDDDTPPELSLNPSNAFNNASLATENQYNDTLPLNMTFSDDRDLYGFKINITSLGSSYYEYENYSINGTEHTFTDKINVSSWDAGTYNVEIEYHDSKTRQRTNPENETNNNVTDDFGWFRGTYEETKPLLFSDESGFLEIILTGDSSITNITGDLYMNDTLQSDTIQTKQSGNWNLSNNISFPVGTYDYVWDLDVEQNDSSSYEAEFKGSIVVSEFGIDDCSEYTHEAVKFNIFDENQASEPLIASLEVDANIWVSSRDNSRPFSTEFEGDDSYTLCLQNATSEYQTDMYVKYTTLNGFTHRYYLFDETISSDLKNLSIYNYNYTEDVSGAKLTIRDYNTYNYYPNIVTKLQRRYPGEAVWRTVQMDESGDFGVVYFNIIESSVDYRFLFYDRDTNRLLRTTESMKLVCDGDLCDLTVTLDGSEEVSLPSPVSVSYDFDEENKDLTVDWEDSDAETKTVRMRVTKETITGSRSICDDTQRAAAGTFNCDLSSQSGDVKVSIFTEGDLTETELIYIDKEMLGSYMSVEESATWTFGVMLTIIMFGVFTGAAGTMIASMIGLTIIYFLGILNAITMTFIIIAGAAAVVIASKIRG